MPAVEARTRFAWVRGTSRPPWTKPATRPITFTDRARQSPHASPLGHAGFPGRHVPDVSVDLHVGQAADGRRSTARANRLRRVSKSAMDSRPASRTDCDGVIKGVGSVLIFLPQILILFGFIACTRRLRLHGPRGVPHGPAHESLWPQRKVVYPAPVISGVRGAGDHGDASDREPPRSTRDDTCRAPDELLRAVAGLCPPDRRLSDGWLCLVGAGACTVRPLHDRVRCRAARGTLPQTARC